MNNLLKDFIAFIKTLDFVDILFVVSLVALVILITTLIYIIKVNDEDEEIDIEEESANTNNNVEEELDLSQITKEIENAPVNPVTLNDYEKEQEEKAIISYDELLKTKDLKEDINYVKEMQLGDLMVKSVDNKNITKTLELPKMKDTHSEIINFTQYEPMADVRLFSYQKEEEFLKTLKKLQKLLD